MTKEVLNHLRDLEANLEDWQVYLRETSPRLFREDRKARHALLHAALAALQASIDVANHWACRLTAQRPESYRGIAELLEREGALPSPLSAKLKELFSLRNVLIHKYQELDLDRLHRHLREGIPPLRAFLRLSKARVGKE